MAAGYREWSCLLCLCLCLCLCTRTRTRTRTHNHNHNHNQADQEPNTGADTAVRGGVPQLQNQVLVLEIQDRFGCLFLDFKGSPRLCFLFGGLKQATWALRGVLLGVFVGRPLPQPPAQRATTALKARQLTS
jgi:hypothetical protein